MEQTSCGYDGCRSDEDKCCRGDNEGWLHINSEALLTEFMVGGWVGLCVCMPESVCVLGLSFPSELSPLEWS